MAIKEFAIGGSDKHGYYVYQSNSKARYFSRYEIPKSTGGWAIVNTRAEAEERLALLEAEEIERQADMAKAKADRKAVRDAERVKADDRFNVGSILYASWGYDQTNIDFYQVVERVGKVTMVLRPIGAETVPGSEGRDCDRVKPVKGDFVAGEEPMRRRINGASVKVSDVAYAWPYMEEEKPNGVYRSWYA